MTRTVISSAAKDVVIGFDQPFVMIGERINPTGRKLLAAGFSEVRITGAMFAPLRPRKTGRTPWRRFRTSARQARLASPKENATPHRQQARA